MSLTSSPAIEPVGTVRDQVINDQFTATFLGAVGGEGQGSGAVPSDHYINATDEVLEARSYVDVAFAKPSDDHVVLSLFAHGTINHVAPASEGSVTMECATQEDLPLVMFTNHMHEYGKAIHTEAVLPDGSVSVIKDDPVWSVEWVANSNYAYRFEDPLIVPKGSNLRPQCTWQNTTNRDLAFPDEMCAFTAFLPGGHAITCLDGVWSKR